MRQYLPALVQKLKHTWSPRRLNSAHRSGWRRRFRFIARYRKYTRSYVQCSGVVVRRRGTLHPAQAMHYVWYAASSLLRPSRVRRFLLARFKRVATATSAIVEAWASRGVRVFLYRKGQNSRMGKGCGSYHSSRRQLRGGSALAGMTLTSSYVAQNLRHYVSARFGRRVTMCRTRQHPHLATQALATDSFELGSYEPRSFGVFRRRRATWSLLRRRTVRRLAATVYGGRIRRGGWR
jgi:hypothetical protein